MVDTGTFNPLGHEHLAGEGAAQHHHASCAALPRQPQRALESFPAIPRLFPRDGAEERLLDDGLHLVL